LEGCRWGWFIVGAQLTFRQQGVCTAEDTSIVGAQLTWRVQSNTCVPTGTGYGPWCMYVRTYTQRCYSPAAMSRQPHSTIPQNIRSFLDEIVDQQTHHKLPAGLHGYAYHSGSTTNSLTLTSHYAKDRTMILSKPKLRGVVACIHITSPCVAVEFPTILK
jgi:hypothetical protein